MKRRLWLASIFIAAFVCCFGLPSFAQTQNENDMWLSPGRTLLFGVMAGVVNVFVNCFLVNHLSSFFCQVDQRKILDTKIKIGLVLGLINIFILRTILGFLMSDGRIVFSVFARYILPTTSLLVAIGFSGILFLVHKFFASRISNQKGYEIVAKVILAIWFFAVAMGGVLAIGQIPMVT